MSMLFVGYYKYKLNIGKIQEQENKGKILYLYVYKK